MNTEQQEDDRTQRDNAFLNWLIEGGAEFNKILWPSSATVRKNGFECLQYVAYIVISIYHFKRNSHLNNLFFNGFRFSEFGHQGSYSN